MPQVSIPDVACPFCKDENGWGICALKKPFANWWNGVVCDGEMNHATCKIYNMATEQGLMLKKPEVNTVTGIDMEVINFYSRGTEYGWLSNFWWSPLKVDGVTYKTNEHYYQSRKAKDVAMRDWIANAPTPFLAMTAGRALKASQMVDNWDNKKVEVMLTGLRAKFQDTTLRDKLKNTGDAILHEDSPTDMFWGVKGKDMLGKLLMQVRSEIV